MKKIVLFMITIVSAIYAELPPYVYDELKVKAPEVIIVQISKVKSSQLSLNQKEIEAQAKIKEIERSVTGLDINETITIRYTVTAMLDGMVGPSPIIEVEADKVYRAYLRQDDQSASYLPAARGKSLEAVE